MDVKAWMWVAFAAIVAALMLMDMGGFGKKQKEMGVRESLYLSLGYIAVALLYCASIYYFIGHKEGEDFLTGYLVEKSLSLDNIFVISLAFKHFQIPRHLQQRVLLYGILGVLLLRGLMIGVGAAIIHEFHSVLYFFGVFLVITGLRMLFMHEHKEKSMEENKILLFLRRYIPVTEELHGSRFFITVFNASTKGRAVRKATPLFVALVFVELADAVFAIDSVPAIFAITTDPFVVFTSNVFAILGLRALYFALSAMLHRFSHLKYALALVLVFIGFKIFLPMFHIEISSFISLVVTLGLLAGGILVSLVKTKG